MVGHGRKYQGVQSRMLNKYPIGLHARGEYFRCCSTTWSPEVQEFILSRMISSSGNIKPIMVVEADESITMYEPNAELTTLEQQPAVHPHLRLKIQRQSHWMNERTRVQKSHNIKPTTILTVEDVKERLCDLLYKEMEGVNRLTGPERAELAREMAKV